MEPEERDLTVALTVAFAWMTILIMGFFAIHHSETNAAAERAALERESEKQTVEVIDRIGQDSRTIGSEYLGIEGEDFVFRRDYRIPGKIGTKIMSCWGEPAYVSNVDFEQGMIEFTVIKEKEESDSHN